MGSEKYFEELFKDDLKKIKRQNIGYCK